MHGAHKQTHTHRTASPTQGVNKTIFYPPMEKLLLKFEENARAPSEKEEKKKQNNAIISVSSSSINCVERFISNHSENCSKKEEKTSRVLGKYVFQYCLVRK